MGLSMEQWLASTSSNPDENTKCWFGIECTKSQLDTLQSHINNQFGGKTPRKISNMKGDEVHMDIYITRKQFDKLNEIIDRVLVNKDGIEE